MKPIISIIIVNYHVAENLLACITSIYNSKNKTSFEIIVVDNDEQKNIDKSLKKLYPHVLYLANANRGFGAGNNTGAKAAHGQFLFFLNPDTLIKDYSLDILSSFLQKNKHAGIVAPLIVDTTNTAYPLQGTDDLTPLSAIFSLSFINKFFPHNPFSKKYWLLDWDKKHSKPVSVVPGTACMISKELFTTIGGFDEKFFLYFEESDLCKRIKERKFDLYILPKAKIFHAWGESTKKSSRNISQIFSQSKFYYFKKHYGIFWAIVVKFFTEFSKNTAIFLGILFLGIFLRLYNLPQNFIFDGEIGDNHLDIKNAYMLHQILLKGPPTSHPWLYFGPLFYWIYEPILIISKFNPVAYAYFGAVISILIIIVNYITIKKLFSSKTALISCYLIAISPLFLFAGRIARFFCIVPLLVYPFLILLAKIVRGEKKWLFLLWFLVSVMLQFHYTPLFLIPVVITALIVKKISLTVKEVLISVLGFFIPFVPLFLYDSKQHFSMMINLLLWIPYRILGFLGIYHKNTVSSSVIHENTVSILNFFSYLFTKTPLNSFSPIGIVLFIIIVIFLAWKILEAIKKHILPVSWLILLIWGFWGFLALFIHGNAPLHYYVPLYSFPVIVLALLFSKLLKNRIGTILVVIALLTISYINFSLFFSQDWFYKYRTDPYSYAIREKAAQTIITDANNRPYELQRVGYYDAYVKNFAQNYIYLLWLYGNEPKDKANVKYIIYEDTSKLPKILRQNQRLFRITTNVAIIREVI